MPLGGNRGGLKFDSFIISGHIASVSRQRGRIEIPIFPAGARHKPRCSFGEERLKCDYVSGNKGAKYLPMYGRWATSSLTNKRSAMTAMK